MKFLFWFLLLTSVAFAQEEKGTSLAEIQKVVNDTLASKWYEKIQLKGYADFRYNRFLETNENYKCNACDKSMGKNKGIFLRRARLTFYGEVSDRVYIYIQPDYSTDAGTAGQNYLQIRDAYFDYALTPNKEYRIRTGITKVPYGWENLQSSSNRGPMDRSDAINTAVPNERDTGVFFMYAPTEIRQRFKDLTSNNLKGSGDYGMFAFGVYNGQTMNKGEENNDLHKVVRLTYPWKLKNGQFIEASIQAYKGEYAITTPTLKNYDDQRGAVSFIVYPQPIGFQFEYNAGKGPDYDANSGKTKTKNLHGGYAQLNYQTYIGTHRFFPYVRYQEYFGGRKLDDGDHYETQEWEMGTEWQPNPAFELTVAYALGNRLIESATPARNLDERGQLLRLQAQFNY